MSARKIILLRDASPALKCYRRQAEHFTSLGLTVKGTRRKRRPNAHHTETKLEMRRLRGAQAWNLRVSRLRKAGLTTRGTQRIYAVRRGDAIILKSELDAFARLLGKFFSQLPAEVQAGALRLENNLGQIRRQLI